MNLTQIKTKFYLFIIAIVIIIGIVIVASILSLKSKKEIPEPPLQTTASPTIAPNIIIPPAKDTQTLSPTTQDIRKQIINGYLVDENGDLLLYKTDALRIEYIPSPDVFFVKIYKDPATTYKKQAQNWFLAFGLNQTDLCNLPVRFILSNSTVRKTNPQFHSLPDGCTGTPLTKP